MKKSTSRSRRYLITKNSILLLVMLVVIFLAVWAWFGGGDVATATGIKMSSNNPEEIEIAVPEKVVKNGHVIDAFPQNNNSWDYNIQFEKTGYLSDLVKDVTSDGKEFIIPGFNASTDYQTGRTVNTEDFWTAAQTSKEVLSDDKPNNDDHYQVVSLDFYLRSHNKTINLSPNSYLASGSELGVYMNESTGRFVTGSTKPLSGTNLYRKSDYGNFSADAIVGAMRVSLIGAPVDSISSDTADDASTYYMESAYNGGTWETNAQKKIIWLPRPDLLLNTTSNDNDWTLTSAITKNHTDSSKTYFHSYYAPKSETRSIHKGVEKKIYYDSNVKSYSGNDATDPGNFVVSGKNFNGSGYPKLDQSPVLSNDGTEVSKTISFTQGTGEKASRPTSGYYVYKYTLNLWIEGEDAEARRSMSNGLFSLFLEFRG